MSEYDKSRDHRKKNYFPSTKDDSTYRRPFILAKNDRDSGKDDKANPTGEKEKQPVILIKAREPSATKEADNQGRQSPKKITGKDHEIETQIIQPTKIAQNESKEKKLLEVKAIVPVTPMAHPVKLITESLEFLPTVAEHLQDTNNNFLVVGVIGAQGVGKSTILNILAHGHDMSNICEKILTSHEQEYHSTSLKSMESETSFGSHGDVPSTHPIEVGVKSMSLDSSGGIPKTAAAKPLVFKCQSMDQIERGNPCTSGVDIYVTESRMILLDAGPVGGGGISRIGGGATAGARVVGGGAGLEVAALFLAVCHVVVFVQDWFADVNMLRLLLSAEMVKPSIPAATNQSQASSHQSSAPGASSGQDVGDSQTGGDHFPHLLFLHNKCSMEDFRPESVKLMQNLYRKAFSKSKMHIESGMFMYNPDTDDSLSSIDGLFHNLNAESCGRPVNMFLMPMVPDDHKKTDIYRGHPTIEELAARLRRLVFGASRNQITNIQLTERTWLHCCSKAWDNIRKSTFFIEYGRLLP